MKRQCPKKQRRRRRNQLHHAQTRALERFGVGFGPIENAEIVRQIQNGRAEFYDRSSNRITRWRVTIAGHNAIVVYDKKRKVVVSVYAEETA